MQQLRWGREARGGVRERGEGGEVKGARAGRGRAAGERGEGASEESGMRSRAPRRWRGGAMGTTRPPAMPRGTGTAPRDTAGENERGRMATGPRRRTAAKGRGNGV